MIRALIKEIPLLVAFAILGALLLVCFWIRQQVETSVLNNFKESQISLILEDSAKFRSWVSQNAEVIQYRVYSASDNQEKLQTSYPELRSLIGGLDTSFFPISALVTVRNLEKFKQAIIDSGLDIKSQVVHEPPRKLQAVLEFSTWAFTILWILTLVLILYFNLERLTTTQFPRWSLMKVLGARAHQVFLPLLSGQMVRVFIAAVFAVLLAQYLAETASQHLAETAGLIPTRDYVLFLFTVVLTTGLIAFSLFYIRYRRVQIG